MKAVIRKNILFIVAVVVSVVLLGVSVVSYRTANANLERLTAQER